MQAGLAAKIAAADVDPGARQIPPVVARRIPRRTLIFVLTGTLAYFAGLLATIPAAAIVEENDRLQVGGTIWRGEAVLATTIRAQWWFSPLTSLANLAFSADWRLTGGGTDLAGSAAQQGAQLQLSAVSGQIDGSLLDAAFPELPLSCRFTGDLRIDRAYLGGQGQLVNGSMRTGPMTCSARQAAGLAAELPEMTGQVGPAGTGSGGALVSIDDAAHIIELRLTPDGMLSVWPTRMAIQRVPFLAGKRFDKKID